MLAEAAPSAQKAAPSGKGLPAGGRPSSRAVILIAVALLALFVFLRGQVGGGDETASPRTTAAVQAESEPVPIALHGIELGAGVALLDDAKTREVVQNLYDGFGGGLAGAASKASWFDAIEAVGVSAYDAKATVRTRLYPDADGSSVAASLCGAAIASGAVGGARVTDESGTTLYECP